MLSVAPSVVWQGAIPDDMIVDFTASAMLDFTTLYPLLDIPDARIQEFDIPIRDIYQQIIATDFGHGDATIDMYISMGTTLAAPITGLSTTCCSSSWWWPCCTPTLSFSSNLEQCLQSHGAHGIARVRLNNLERGFPGHRGMHHHRQICIHPMCRHHCQLANGSGQRRAGDLCDLVGRLPGEWPGLNCCRTF